MLEVPAVGATKASGHRRSAVSLSVTWSYAHMDQIDSARADFDTRTA